MKRALLIIGAFGIAVACGLPSVDELARGPVAMPDGGADATTPAIVDSGAADVATVVEAGAPRSCADIHAADPGAKDGFFPSANGELYCDMTTAGGGWTLVARSSGTDGDGDFGWKQRRGDVRAEHDPYCLPVLTIDLPFVAVLVGARTDDGYGWGNAYVLELTRDALLAAPSSNVPVPNRTYAVGDCHPNHGGPNMFAYAGFVDTRDHFHFRDIEGVKDEGGTAYGFFDDQLYTKYEDCDQGGNVNTDDGMLMVR